VPDSVSRAWALESARSGPNCRATLPDIVLATTFTYVSPTARDNRQVSDNAGMRLISIRGFAYSTSATRGAEESAYYTPAVPRPQPGIKPHGV